ncbi:MAG TPA: hypothetical protein VFR14_14090 [Candidatus Limnocylindrales bacterium]|nr:hypothetical protein [Candidatus Limnocylindrales bacterium]
MTHRRRGRLGRLAIALLLAAQAIVVAGPVPAGAATAFRLDVSTPTDFVAQTNFVQCVGASMQMMLNMIEAEDDRTAAEQLRLQDIARYYSGSRPDGRQRQGASVRGWSAGLNLEGAGPYRLVGTTTIEEAMRVAATAISQTGKPVGLLVWRGRHAWVMSGFTATADPSTTADFTVTEAIVLDPLYPHGSKTWGPSPKPREALSISELGRQFVQRRTGQSARSWLSSFAGQYVMVVPMRAMLDRHVGLLPA